MAARKRRPDESFKQYRINLKKEEYRIQRKLKGKTAFNSATFFFNLVKSLLTGMFEKKVVRQKGKSYRNPFRVEGKNYARRRA